MAPENFFFLFEYKLIYNVVLVSDVQQSDSLMHIYMYIYIPFHILFHYSLAQDTEYSSLCYTVAQYPCCLFYKQ